MATSFTPLTKDFAWTLSTTDSSGNPLPTGEANSGSTVGIRADGDTTHSAGNYQYLITVGPNVSTVTLSQVIQAKVPQGANYWAAVDQTDMLNGSPATSVWTAEVPFSLPVQVVAPSAPTGFIVA
jgi:hypothetical protein